MNKYICRIEKYFGGYIDFKIEADSKASAKLEAVKRAETGGNCKVNTLKIKKVNKF